MKGLGGSIPQVVNNGPGGGYGRLFYSQRENALILNKTLAPGYGVLKAGTVMMENNSTAGNKGLLVPYVPVTGSQIAALNNNAAIGISPMVVDGTSGTVYISVQNSYRFVVGDHIIYQNVTGNGLVDCGVITAIDITTNPLYAAITCTAYTATNATVADHAYIYTQADLASVGTPWATAKYILDKDVDTGIGEDALGALSSVVVSNAVLYSGSLINCTAAALTALGAVTDGQFTILK